MVPPARSQQIQQLEEFKAPGIVRWSNWFFQRAPFVSGRFAAGRNTVGGAKYVVRMKIGETVVLSTVCRARMRAGVGAARTRRLQQQHRAAVQTRSRAAAAAGSGFCSHRFAMSIA